MKRLIFLFLLVSQPLFAREQLVCIHGFMGWPSRLKPMQKAMEMIGKEVTIWEYPSKYKKIRAHASDFVSYLKEMAKENPGVPISFITHSMGGLVLRAAINDSECPIEARMGRAVLIATPNKGCHFAHAVGANKLVKKIVGSSAGLEMIRSFENGFADLGSFPCGMDVLVIAGLSSINPFIREDSDGLVTVSETHLDTPHRHVVVRENHDGIHHSKGVIKLVRKFFMEPLRMYKTPNI